MRSFLSLTAALLLATQLPSVTADAAPRRGRSHAVRRNVPSITWKTNHGSRVTVGARFRGHGHVAPIRRTPTTRSVAMPVKQSHVKTHGAAAHTKHHHKHYAFGRTLVGRGQIVAEARVVVPATTVSILAHEPSEAVIVETPVVPKTDTPELWHAESVIDGTRLVVRREGQIQQVRLLGVAMPAIEEEECGKHLESLAEGQDVILVFDNALAPQDAEGITTAYVYLAEDDSLLNLEILKAGRGLAEGGYEHNYTELFVAAQAEARATARGIWAGIPAPGE